jgi:hypothetical protein
LLAKTPRLAPRRTGNQYTRFSLATSVSWKENGNPSYKTRPELHRVICWNKLADWAGDLHKGAYVEVEGELGIANTRLLSLTAASALKKSTRLQFWRWTALRDKAGLIPRIQIPLTNRSSDRLRQASNQWIGARLFP